MDRELFLATLNSAILAESDEDRELHIATLSGVLDELDALRADLASAQSGYDEVSLKLVDEHEAHERLKAEYQERFEQGELAKEEDGEDEIKTIKGLFKVKEEN